VTLVSVSCPLCGSETSALFTTADVNLEVSEDRFEYRRCERCRAIFLANPPNDVGRYYPPDYYPAFDAERINELARGQSWRTELLRKHVEPGRLIDVGSGSGVFAHGAKQAGFDVTAIEMDPRSCEDLRSIVEVEAVQSDDPARVLSTLAPSRAITFWHVLEHLPNPWECVESASENLEGGGVLLTAMPNPDSLQFRLLGRRWPHVDAPRHLFLIPPGTLKEKAAALGLDCVELTTADLGAERYDSFGWQGLLPPVCPRASIHSARIGWLIATLVSPLERRNLNGSTYTAIFRKRRD
jgi:2-polyprenyl-3-methyl-5-hydroxy-6-metoxy-1,4-benzoquinol methylase